MLTAALLALVLAAPTPRPPALPTPPALPALMPAAPAPHDSRRIGEWPREPSGKTVSIGDHVSMDEALETIATAGGWNLIANTGRLGDRTLVVTLRNAPVEEALDAVLEGSPLVATRFGNTVTVAPGRVAPAAEAPVLSGFDKPTGKRFTGEFSDEPVDRALRKVADAAGLSVVFPPGLRGTISGHFREAPAEDVLRAVLAQAGLVASREGSIVTVARGGGGSSLVIDGRRRMTVPGVDGDLGREIDQAVRGAKRDADQARRDAKQARRDAKQAHRDAGAAEGDAEDDADAEVVPGTGKAAAGGRRHGDKVVRGDVTIGPGERARDVVVFGGLARLEPAATAKQVTVILGSADIGPGATVEHEVVAIGGDIHVAPGAHVGGDAVSIGGKIVIDEGAEVEGQQTAIDVPGLGGILSMAGARSRMGGHTQSVAWRIGRALTEFIVFFGLGLLLFLLFPRRIEAVTGSLQHAPGKAVLTGILGTLALPIAALLLVVTVIGIPFVAVLVMAVVAATVMGYTALALWFGRALPFRFEKGAPILQLAIGTVVLVAIAQVPVLGKLSLVAGWLLVFGVVLRTRFGQSPQPPPAVYGTTAPPPPAPAS